MVVADGGAGAVAVTAQPECPWSASSQAGWISDLSPASGQGTATVTFRAAANPAPSAREAEIIINDDHVRVSQEAAPCRFAIAPDEQTISAGGGTASVAVSVLTGCAWTARSNAPWITIASAESGNGNGSVSLRVAANTGGARTGTVSIGDRTHTVTQGAGSELPPPTPPTTPACTYTINPVSQAIGATGGTGAPVTVMAATGCAWTAASNASWITLSSGANGSGNGSVAFTVAANTGASRSGTITIATLTFTVTQAAASAPPPPPPPCTYSVDPPSASIGAAGGTGSVAVTAGTACAWTATTTASWITITSGGAGTGNGSVGFTVAANTGAARTDTITIAGQAFTVTQAAAPAPPPPPPCTYSIDPTSAPVVAAGGTGSVAVTAGTACAWTAITTASWITITSGAIGIGNGTVAYSVAANTTGAGRSDKVFIAGQPFTIIQSP
jgi:hypothetical protein